VDGGPYRDSLARGARSSACGQCDLPASTSPVIEYREGNDPPTTRKLPGLNEFGPLVQATGVTEDQVL
jgi:hypothetical protein